MPESFEESYIFPWYSRIRRIKGIYHPDSIEKFRTWPDLNKTAQIHLSYLEFCDKLLKQGWSSEWKQILAVGPFVKRSRMYGSIPFVIIADYDYPYKHLLNISEVLADAFLEFAILPDFHIFTDDFVKYLEETDNREWKNTQRISILLGRTS